MDLRDDDHLEAQVDEELEELLLEDPSVSRKPFTEINKAALESFRSGDRLRALALYRVLFRKVTRDHLTHQQLHVCHLNCGSVYLDLRLPHKALDHIHRCLELIRQSPKSELLQSPTYIKALRHQGEALLQMNRTQEAATALQEALRLDPDSLLVKAVLDEVSKRMAGEKTSGSSSLTRLALPPPPPVCRIKALPHSVQVGRLDVMDVLPMRLISPEHAERDHDTRDTHTFLNIQTDLSRPLEYLTRYLRDTNRLPQMRTAITAAVRHIEEVRDLDCRVLILGGGAGALAMMALDAGARHVTTVDRWLYQTQSCQEVLQHNGYPSDQYKVVCKRATSLKLVEDVPVSCNLVVCDLIDDGLLTEGLLPALQHALALLTIVDPEVIPSTARVIMRAAEISCPPVAGLDVSALDEFRWYPSPCIARPWSSFQPRRWLSAPQQCLWINLKLPPDCSHCHEEDVTFTREGDCNAVVYWYELTLWGEICFSTGARDPTLALPAPEGCQWSLAGPPAAPPTSWCQPAVHFLPGPLPVKEGTVLPVRVCHNTVRLSFEIHEGDYRYLGTKDVSFPHQQFEMVEDQGRAQSYNEAIKRAVQRVKAKSGEVHALDLGCGTGLLAMMAARAGATSVVGVEVYPHLVEVSRKNLTRNGLSSQVTVHNRDVALIERGHEVRHHGANLAVFDLFDCGLLGHGVLSLLEVVRRRVLRPEAVMVPRAAVVYCMAVEVLSNIMEEGLPPGGPAARDDEQTSKSPDLQEARPAEGGGSVHQPAESGEGMCSGSVRLSSPQKTMGHEANPSSSSTTSSSSRPHSYLPLNKYWWDKQYRAVHLDQIPHRPLTKPVKVFDFVFEGPPGSIKYPSEATLSMEATEGGYLTAVAFWFELQLDDHCTLNSGPTYILKAGPQEHVPTSTPLHGPEGPTGDVSQGLQEPVSHTGHMGCSGDTPLNSSSPQLDTGVSQPDHHEPGNSPTAGSGSMSSGGGKNKLPHLDPCHNGPYSSQNIAGVPSTTGLCVPLQHVALTEQVEPLASTSEAQPSLGNGVRATLGDTGDSLAGHPPESEPPCMSSTATGRHYWGQALQYLDHWGPVQPGNKITLIAQRQGGRIHFTRSILKGEDLADQVVEAPKAPWKVEWGGGPSVENPHYQRAHYCELIINEFLQRLPAARPPSVEKELRVMMNHCGSLQLDPRVIQRVMQKLVIMERLFAGPGGTARCPSVLPEHVLGDEMQCG